MKIKKDLWLILIVIFVFCNIFVFLYYEKESRVEVLIEKTKRIHKSQIDSAIYQYKSSNEFIFNSTINKEEVLILQKKALDSKDEIQRDIYRKKLYNKLKSNYEHLRTFGIKQLHFHLPNSVSFLRFHKPNKYGDSLKKIRHSVNIVNKEKKAIFGFEEGRIFNGYRMVYPLFYKKEHIGSVEISIGFNAINKVSLHNYNSFQYMMLNKNIVEGKLFSGEKKNYDQSFISDNFYHETNSFSSYKNEFNTKKHNISIKQFSKLNKYLNKNIKQTKLLEYKPFVEFIVLDGTYYFTSFLPIDNIKKQNIGYIVSYDKCACVDDIYYEYLVKIIIVVVFLFFIIYYLLNEIKLKNKLKNLTSEAKQDRDKAILSSKSKAEFLANMSHEIRTPLNGVLGFVDILKDSVTNKQNREYLEIIDNSSQHLLGVIDDILDFSKIESGKLYIENCDFDTKKEFELIKSLFEAKASQKDLTLNLMIDKNIPPFINSDSLRIKQIISNLLSNAIKFTDNGKFITISISFKENYLYVSVKDQGIGISKDKQNHIFKAFSQEDGSTTRKYGGTGLGLTISSELVKLLGGKLQLNSILGTGSEFYFSIPVTIGKDIDIQPKDTKIEDFGGKKVLLVEDNIPNQMFMKVILKKMNLNYEIASDGIEAIEMFKNNSYDVVLMDENMPNMNGIEATKHILEYEKSNNLKHTPIIALTANALKGDREKFLKAGMDEYLTKPLNKLKLNNLINSFIET
ncbi:MAG: ATP-binding protein [Campylobacterota bacterium]|nr:ATP-binding protein [Campylobacterota bacterium]